MIRTRIVNKTLTIEDLFAKFGIDPYENNSRWIDFYLQVRTPFGYKQIRNLFTTEKQNQVTTYFSNSKTLTTSEDHLLKIGEEWVKVKDLQVGDRVITNSGTTKVTKQIRLKKPRVLYDMSVDEVYCYYSNGILSHNSWMLVNLGAMAVQRGYTVCHYTLELSEYYVGKRYDALFTGIDVQNVQKNREAIEQAVSSLKGKLIIKEFPMGKATTHTIESHIQKCRDLGYPPDLVIIDYVDLLKSKTRSIDPKDAIDDVYTATKGMARELKVPIWTVSQVNRSGAKDDVIEGDKAAGSYNKMMIADFAMSLSRKRQDKVNGTGRMHIMKNRYGCDGMTYSAKISTNTGHIEINPDSMDDDELTFDTSTPTTGSNKPFNSGLDKDEKAYLANKFFELGM